MKRFKCDEVTPGDRILIVDSINPCWTTGREYTVLKTAIGWVIECNCNAQLGFEELGDATFELVKLGGPW